MKSMSDDPSLVPEEDAFADDQGEAAAQWETLPPERDFFATPYDPPIKALVQEIRDKELVVQPFFQRYQVWDSKRKSRFVESILLNIPIPTLFFAEDEDKSKVVVDGQQRLIALKDYLDNRYKLSGLEVLHGLNGKSFDELTDRQQRIIRNRTLRCLVISAKSDSEIRFQVFERLNQGGVPLNAQEVRHCVYRGELNQLLHELVKDKDWQTVFGRSEPHPRMVDCELVLRFFAIRDALPAYSPPLKTLLNQFMRDHRHPSQEEIRSLRASFKSAVAAVAAAFPEYPFRRVFEGDSGPTRDRSLNRAVFDIQMIVMEGLDPSWARSHTERIQKAFENLCLKDPRFSDSVSRATADKSRMDYRLRRWADALKEIGAQLPSESRIPDASSEGEEK